MLDITADQTDRNPIIRATETRATDRTSEQVSFDLSIIENDARADQFACHLSVHNNTRGPINILALNYRLSDGATVLKNENTSFFDLSDEYERLKKDVSSIVTSIGVTNSEAYRKEFSKRYLEGMRENFSFSNVMLVYWYLSTGRLKVVAEQFERRLQTMTFPVMSASDAQQILDDFEKKDLNMEAVSDVLNAKIRRMTSIESIDKNFLRPEFIAQVPAGDKFERIYIVRARRRWTSIGSYTVAFDLKLGWTDAVAYPSASVQNLERLISRSTSFKVTPSPIALTLFSIVFAVAGTVMSLFPKLKENDSYHTLANFSFVQQYFIASVLAIVIFNSLEMTELKGKVTSISWRSAMFIGIVCGLLSERMLKAIISFVQ